MKKRLLTFVLSLAMIAAFMPFLPAEVYAAEMPIEIDGITPVAGEAPVTIDDDYYYYPMDYRLTEMKWYNSSDKLVKGTFHPGEDYHVKLTFESDTVVSEDEASIVIDGVTYDMYSDDCIIQSYGTTVVFECWFRNIKAQGFMIFLDADDNVIKTYSDHNTIFKMKKYNGTAPVTYYWYKCDKDGNISGSSIYHNTTGKFTMKNLGYNQGLHYVAVRAKDDNGNRSNKEVLKLKIYYVLNDATIKVKDRTYNGKSGRTADVTITAKINGVTKTLKKGTDYVIDYNKFSEKRKNVGTYRFSIGPKGYYYYNYPLASDEFDIYNYYDHSFKVNPKGTSISSVTPGSKKLIVKWNKQSEKMSLSRITGYQVQVATNSSFTAGKKTYLVKGYSSTTKTFKDLKGGKKYYVRVRTYKTVDGVKCYSTWSKVTTRTTKY